MKYSTAWLLGLVGGPLWIFQESCGFPISSYWSLAAARQQKIPPLLLFENSGGATSSSTRNCEDIDRRTLLTWGLTGVSVLGVTPAQAVPRGGKQSSLFLLSTKNSTSAGSLQNEPVSVETTALSSELCLLKLLPVENKIFRQLEGYVEGLSKLRLSVNDASSWREANRKMQAALSFLDSKRSLIQPEFNPDDSAILQIVKGERGEQVIESLRNELVGLIESTKKSNGPETFRRQKEALLALSDIGELLVASFPYDVPTEGKFSYLPRLTGRARVTFTFKRDNELLGNVTIMADGYAAPITAGNFVDLSVRQFYTGLPIKTVKKRFGTPINIIDDILGFEKLGIEDDKLSADSVTLPILGDFNEGFFDPLTAKPRRIPLEIVRLDNDLGTTSKLSYAEGFSESELSQSKATVEPSKDVKTLLSFDIPGLVAFNHPDKNLNGGSSGFFSLQMENMEPSKRTLFDGKYAPFGYIIDGYDLFQELQAGDVIDSTMVGEWGQLNLVKIRGASFSDVMQGDEE